MRTLGIIGAFAAVLCGLSGSGPAIQQSVASPSVKPENVAATVQAKPAEARSTTAAIGGTPAVWRSYAWQPWPQHERSMRRAERDHFGRDFGRSYRSWQGNRRGELRAWQTPPQYGWRYGWRDDRTRGAWYNNDRDRWRFRGEPWRYEFRRPWAGDRRWVHSSESSSPNYRR